MSLSEAIYDAQVGHLKWNDVHRSNPRAYDDILKFAVCRDPFDRFVSAFEFLKGGGINASDRSFSKEVLEPFSDVNEFALALTDIGFRSRVLNKIHFQSQHSFVCRPNGEVMVDYLIAFDRLANDVPAILAGRRALDIPHVNRTSGDSTRAEALSDEVRSVIADIYADDLLLMNSTLGVSPVRGTMIRPSLKRDVA
jgi:hypothetical protein